MYDIEFDTPFTVEYGHIIELDTSLYVPQVTDDSVAIEIDSPNWTTISGYSGQHGYSGPVMHSSETLSPGLLKALEEKYPGDIFALTIVEDADDPENLIGWLILRNIAISAVE